MFYILLLIGIIYGIHEKYQIWKVNEELKEREAMRRRMEERQKKKN